MKIDILTLFPNMFNGFLSESILKRAQEKGIATIQTHNIRDIASDKHHTVDDSPYGGGPGMVMRVDILDKALKKVKSKDKSKNPIVILMTPQGKTFNQSYAKKLSRKSWLIFICGHYEGYDERIRNLVDEEISIGDYVLTGGEIPSMVLIDSITRLIPGAIGKDESTKEESFSLQNLSISENMKIKNSKNQPLKIKKLKIENCLLEYPQYTRPEKYKNMIVPEILLSGNHQEINKWRQSAALEKTKKKRPDLLK